jgi:ubiquinone/menaquinone biosynthesis C-methylase UbiE
MSDDVLSRSWGAMTRERAAAYMRTFGHPAQSSKQLLVDILEIHVKKRPMSILEIGCGNGQIYDYMRKRGIDCTYTGTDFSEPLLQAARSVHVGDPKARFLNSDAHDLEHAGDGFDVAIYSQVLEALASPEKSLRRARELASQTIIRFFEAPNHDVDTVELREMEIGDGRMVPYIRRSMSRDYYRLILSKIGCRSVDIYRDDLSPDEVHVLSFE